MSTGQNRGLRLALCAIGAVVALAIGWNIPVHLRAVEVAVLQRAGEHSPTLTSRAQALERANHAQVAALIFSAAHSQKSASPGAAAKTEALFPGGPSVSMTTPITTLLIKPENRDSLLAWLKTSPSGGVHDVLRVRELTNTVLFPASSTAAGQALDSAVALSGWLLASDNLSAGLRDTVQKDAVAASTDSQPLEEILMNLLSLGQRLDREQLLAFVGPIDDSGTLDTLSSQMRNAGDRLADLFTAVVVTQKPRLVAAYLVNFSDTGFADLSTSLRYGEGGLELLLQRQQRLANTTPTQPAFLARAMAEAALRAPWFALMLKWFFFMVSGFLFAAAAHFARPLPDRLEAPLRVRGFHLIRELLFALGFLLVVLLLSEPFLAQESQKTQIAFHLRLPFTGAAATSPQPLTKTKLMDTRSLITLALFFVLQGLIYCACLAKLAEIRRQKIPPRVQLKLLENEEHLFDGGLYLGFAGTIVCLILVSLGVIQQSLMAAYSSTSFGIIFVSIFKIFNLRPVRRHLLMQAEEQIPTVVTAPVAPVVPARAPLATTT